MKTKSLFLTLTLGLVASLFACQDGGVMAPDDLQPQFAKGGNKKPPPDPPTGGPTLNLTGAPGVPGVIGGYAEDGVSWSYRNGEFRGNAAQDAIAVTIDPVAIDLPNCKVLPEGSPVGVDLKAALQNGLSGISAVLRVDMAKAEGTGGESGIHRITSYVDGPVVRYFWVGPRYEFDGLFDHDATVSGFADGDDDITYTLTGGIIGVRGQGNPKKAVQIACPYTGSVAVTLTK